ncbi:MAG: efflux RND transporter periplasmic adaptor subunit [Pirellulales bacterium]
MRTWLKWLIGVVVLAGAGTAAYKPAMKYWARRNLPVWRTASVEQGSIVSVVNSTGTVKPVLEVAVGSFVSGPILELHCDFNQEVKKGDLLAKIDPRIYKANVLRDEASLSNREADVFRVKAQLQLAINDEKRAVALRNEDKSFITQAEMDKFRFGRLSLEAQLKVADSAVEQAQATLDNSLTNLEYTEIRSPVDGIVINRKVDPGQTVAASFQTPELFVVAPEMRKEMHIHASVDEADIGLIKAAQHRAYPATFTVDAYPEKLFTGTIHEIRLNSTTLQNVVTYPVIVSSPNPDLQLLPGMTASLSFQVDQRDEVIKIPNAALRFYPLQKHVRPEDVPILEGQSLSDGQHDGQTSEKSLSADDRSQLRRERHRRHVWMVDGDLLKAVEVVTGLSDSKFTEMVEGTLNTGDVLVTGIQPSQSGTR